jgi:hypothetical protein
MSGWPTRLSRSALGPTPQDRKPVTDPNKQLGAGIADLLFWQAAGINVVSDKAWVLLASSAASILAHSEAWNPNGGTPPGFSRTSAGLYVVTYAATVADKDGNAVAPAIVAGKAYPQGLVALIAVASVAGDGRTVTITITDHAGTATDAAVLLEVK